jgi:hypothetical protein
MDKVPTVSEYPVVAPVLNVPPLSIILEEFEITPAAPSCKVPAVIVVVPSYEFGPEIVVIPDPELLTSSFPPDPEIVLETVIPPVLELTKLKVEPLPIDTPPVPMVNKFEVVLVMRPTLVPETSAVIVKPLVKVAAAPV